MNKLIVCGFALWLAACQSPSEKKANHFQDISQNTQAPQSELQKSMERGNLVYEDFCITCHRADGAGVSGTFPPLAKSDWLTEKRTESIHAIKYGQRGEIVVNGETYNGIMTPMGLADDEVADVMNFIMNSWGNEQDKMVTEEEVAAVEK